MEDFFFISKEQNKFAISPKTTILLLHFQCRKTCIHSSIGRVAVFETVGCRFEPYWVHQSCEAGQTQTVTQTHRKCLYLRDIRKIRVSVFCMCISQTAFACPGGGMVDTYV